MSIDIPYPLSVWMQGTAAIHFKSGHVLRRRLSRDTADRVRWMVDGDQGSDRVEWTALDWINFSSEEVLAVEWKGEEDLGWNLDPDQRRAQAANGYHHGPIRALVDHWDGDTEPSYSVAALSVINAMMSEGFGTLTFAQAATRFAGVDGANLIARTRCLIIDDHAEPDPAPEPTPRSAAEPTGEPEPEAESESEAAASDGPADPDVAEQDSQKEGS